jgi:hypothetical protein
MFSIIHILFVALVAASSVSGLIIPRHRSVQLASRTDVPSTYAVGYLEVSPTNICP